MYNKVKEYIINNFTTDEDKVILNVFADEARKLEDLESMKATDGWKSIEKSIRDELRTRLREGIKDDAKAQVLLDLLETVETKSRSQILEDEIEATLPK